MHGKGDSHMVGRGKPRPGATMHRKARRVAWHPQGVPLHVRGRCDVWGRDKGRGNM